MNSYQNFLYFFDEKIKEKLTPFLFEYDFFPSNNYINYNILEYAISYSNKENSSKNLHISIGGDPREQGYENISLSFSYDNVNISLSDLFSLYNDGNYIFGELECKTSVPFDDGLDNLITILKNYGNPFLEKEDAKLNIFIEQKQNERIIQRSKTKLISTEKEMIIVLVGITFILTLIFTNTKDYFSLKFIQNLLISSVSIFFIVMLIGSLPDFKTKKTNRRNYP